MKTYIFDIETLALPESEMPAFDEAGVALGNLKDPEKRNAKLLEAKTEWIAKAALDPMRGRVAMIGSKGIGEPSTIFHDNDEGRMLKEFLEWMGTMIWDGNIIAGFNCHSFDMRFMAIRAWKHGIKFPQVLREGRYWSRQIIDLREQWLMGERSPEKGTSSLDSIAKFLGLPAKLGSGKDFAGLDLEQRKAYLTRDLEITEDLYLRMN